ncbi:MAG TPA: hypothetical protein ENO22_01805 [candidate division Zixibacteria bacterium]|nr:hypothetical protein [candidate division Zixibacteria bacterium]
MLNTINCWSCKEEIEVPEKVTRQDECPNCSTPLKCCFHCRFYDKEAYHQCLEPQAEWVRYKEKANFCEYFKYRFAYMEKQEEMPLDTPEARKNAWDSLFDDE